VRLVTPLEGQDVDRVLSKAFSPTTASYAVYTRDLDDASVERIREALLAVRLPDGRAAFDGVWTFEELYGRAVPAGGPTLLFAPAVGVRPSVDAKTPVAERAPSDGRRGAHQRDGIVLLAGPHVVARDLGRVALYDVSPTLLWTMGAAIPTDIDGRILFEAFDDDYAATQEVREVESGEIVRDASTDADEGEVADRLRALGYL
jgi:hypothetical protein